MTHPLWCAPLYCTAGVPRGGHRTEPLALDLTALRGLLPLPEQLLAYVWQATDQPSVSWLRLEPPLRAGGYGPVLTIPIGPATRLLRQLEGLVREVTGPAAGPLGECVAPGPGGLLYDRHDTDPGEAGGPLPSGVAGLALSRTARRLPRANGGAW